MSTTPFMLWVTIPKAAEVTGYTIIAIETKIHRGVWPEGKVWKKAPDGRLLVNLEAYNQWVEGTLTVA